MQSASWQPSSMSYSQLPIKAEEVRPISTQLPTPLPTPLSPPKPPQRLLVLGVPSNAMSAQTMNSPHQDPAPAPQTCAISQTAVSASSPVTPDRSTGKTQTPELEVSVTPDLATPDLVSDIRRERYPPPPLGRIDDPLIYGINLSITGELVRSSDVSEWEFPSLEKLRELRIRLIQFMEENRLKQADICRFTGLGAPYLSFMVKDPTISNFSSRRRVEVYSVLQTFFKKIDTKEITLEEVARLVLLSKATARAANSRRRGAAKVGANRRVGIEGEAPPIIRRRRRGRPRLLERSREDEYYNSGAKEEEFNFDDFIAGAATGGEGLFQGSELFGLANSFRRHRSAPRVREDSGEWKKALLSESASFDLLTTNNSEVNTPTKMFEGDVLQQARGILNPEKQQAALQRLVSAAAFAIGHQNEVPDANNDSQSEVLGVLIQNLLSQQTSKSSSDPFALLSRTPSKPSRRPSLQGGLLDDSSSDPPTFALLRNDAADTNSLSPASLRSKGGSTDMSEAIFGASASGESNKVEDSAESVLQALLESQPADATPADKIRFGTGWGKEVDVEISDAFASNLRELLASDKLDDKFASPVSGRVGVVRLHWSWDGDSSDEDILWDISEVGSAIDAFVDSYIRELHLPKEPVGVHLLHSFRKQVEDQKNFDSMFDSVCQHLKIRLGNSRVEQMPGMTRKILIDCYHEGLRVVDAVTWNLRSSLQDIRSFIKSVMLDLNLPSSFLFVLFSAFIRAITREKLKFIHECGDLLMGNLNHEIQNSLNFKRDRKRHIQPNTPQLLQDASQTSKRVCRTPTEVETAVEQDTQSLSPVVSDGTDSERQLSPKSVVPATPDPETPDPTDSSLEASNSPIKPEFPLSLTSSQDPPPPSPVLLRTCSPTVSRAMFSEAIANPEGFVSLTEPVPIPKPAEETRRTRRSEFASYGVYT